MKKVRPSKTWTPPAKPQPKEEEEEEEKREEQKRKREEQEKRKKEEQEKRKEVKLVPKPEPGKMLCSADPGRLTRKNVSGTSGQDLGREEKDLALLGVCILTGEERGECLSFGKWDPKARQWKALASQPQRERKGTSNEIKGFLLCLCWSADESCHPDSSCFHSATS